MYWNEEESNGGQSAVGVVRIYSNTTASTMERVVHVMYPVRAVLLNFNVELRQNVLQWTNPCGIPIC